MQQTPHGQRECSNCVFYHPERQKKPCSAFGQLQNGDKDCSLYIEQGGKSNEQFDSRRK